MSLSHDCHDRFGEIKSACMGIKAHHDPAAAEYIWEKSMPFDEVASHISIVNKDKLSICPHRFSVGAVFFKRKFVTDMDYFAIGESGDLGVEEVQMSDFCSRNSFAIYIAQDCFVGHLGFGPQKKR